MDDLLSGPEIPSDYGSVMVEWYRDTSRGVIVRDFAVQHIGLYRTLCTSLESEQNVLDRFFQR